GDGDIQINNGSSIGAGIKFVTANDFTLSGGTSLTNSVEVYALGAVTVTNDLTVPIGSTLYSKSSADGAISTGGSVNANCVAPYGQVYMNYGAIRGLIYADRLRTANSGEIRGGIIVGQSSSIQGSIQIYYDATYLPAGLLGLGGTGDVSAEAGLSISDWQEVY
ncbi:MAG: hypothetical protein ABIE84_05090, partial [bacterium]